MAEINILILSAGTRNKVVQYFRNTLHGLNPPGRVIATDMQEIAPAIYEADAYYLVPSITEPGYLDMILDTCDRVLLLSDGKLAADGPAEEMLRDQKLLEEHLLELPLRFS